MAESASKPEKFRGDAAVVVLGIMVLVIGLWMVATIVAAKIDVLQTRIGFLDESVKRVSMQIVELQNHVLDEKMAAPVEPAAAAPAAPAPATAGAAKPKTKPAAR